MVKIPNTREEREGTGRRKRAPERGGGVLLTGQKGEREREGEGVRGLLTH